jgi:large subunit ribosomal protein L6
MSRIGKSPIIIKPGVTVTVEKDRVLVKGAKGSLSFLIPKGITVSLEDQVVNVKLSGQDGNSALHGLVRAQIENMVTGTHDGWTKTLVLSGVGYRAALNGANLVLTVGFSHPVTIVPPTGIQFSIVEGKIVVSGIDKQLVGQIASDIRKVRPPEPYKGKGIMYEGEHVRRKAGKSAKGVGGAPGAK